MSSNPPNTRFLLAGKLLLGLGLILAVAVVVGGFWPRSESRGFMDIPAESSTTASPVAESSAATSSTVLTPFESAAQADAVLGLAAAADPVKVYADPVPGATLLRSFPKHGELNVLTTFYALAEAVDDLGRTWYQIQLPVRPNGSKGWVKAEDFDMFEIPYRLEVHLADFRLDVLERGRVLKSYSIGLGKEETPTPLGEYYVTTKMRPPDPNTAYGALAIGVSAFSEQLTDWPGGGQVGIHGTNDPAGSIGRRVSHGCIRLSNEDILELTNYAPLGTPVLITD